MTGLGLQSRARPAGCDVTIPLNALTEDRLVFTPEEARLQEFGNWRLKKGGFWPHTGPYPTDVFWTISGCL